MLEEPSAKEMLKGILPMILTDDIHPEFMVFEGKQDLEARVTRRIKGWRAPNSSFIIMRDEDSGDCRILKNKLLQLCRDASREDIPVMVRIACRELESFYLGDLAAVERGLGVSGLASLQNKAKYREPDKQGSPSDILNKLTKGRYMKVPGSRVIAQHLNIDQNRSHSFKVLVTGIKRMVRQADIA